MLDLVFEILFELLLEGSMEAVQSRRVPLPLRVFLLGVLAAVYGGLLFVIIEIAVVYKSIVAGIIAVLYVVFAVMLIRKKYETYKIKRGTY